MLCCVSRKALKTSTSPKKSSTGEFEAYLSSKLQASASTTLDDILVKLDRDEPPVLLPCSICGRTFKPQSLEKHTVICARSLAKKRKPFDSAKQRIRGTELEEFLPKLTKKKFYPEERRDTSTWKETHDEFIKTIRAARGDTFQQIEATVNRQTTTTAVPGPPTRANEKGLCPTCHRQFGIKAYDRHVAWCRDRITRAPASPATNMAKERLEARIKYRAPALKNRRLTNREKYAPSKKTVSPLSGTRIQENISLPHCNKLAENPSIKPSAIAERRSGQGKNDGVIAPGPLKSRLADRSTTNDHISSLPLVPLFYPAHSRNNQDSHQVPTSIINLLPMSLEAKRRVRRSRDSKKIPNSVVPSESYGQSKVSDISAAVNNDVVEMRPCDIHVVEGGLITWKQISDVKKRIKINQAEILEGTSSSHINKLDQTYLIRDSNHAEIIDKSSNNISRATLEFLLDDTSDKIEPTSSLSPEKFNFDITCASTPVSFKEINRSNDTTIIHDNDTKKPTTMTGMIAESCGTYADGNSQVLVIEKITPLASINFKNTPLDSPASTSRYFTNDSLDSPGRKFIRKKLKKKMNLLRSSTDSLISSIEAENEWRLQENCCINGVDTVKQSKLSCKAKTSIFVALPSLKPACETVEKTQDSAAMPCWRKIMKNSKSRLINHLMKNRVDLLPPLIPSKHRSCTQDCRPAWTNYVRKHPDFNLVLTGRTGVCQDYDSFHQAERQLNELLSDACSDKSFPDSPSSHKTTSSSPIYAQSHSSAFALYPKPLSLDKVAEKRASLIAPPSEFDDMSTGFSSSDSTETNLTSKEYFPQLEPHIRDDQANKNRNNQPVLGRRLIIDKSKALGVNNSSLDINLNVKNISTDRNNHKIAPKVGRTQLVRSNSVRATSAPKIPDRKDSLQSNKIISQSNPNSRLHSRATNSGNNISGSNLSLSSIVSSEVEIKLPNSLFDDFASSLDDDSNSFPSLRSFLKNDSLSISSPVQPSRQRNGQISDEDLSSPDSYKKQEQSKLSADSAYSSLNRKYSNEKAAKLEEEISGYRRGERENQINALAKLSKFCHECGTRFPLTAKFCCECGVQRLAL